MDLETLDPEVYKHLPKGCTVLSISRHGETNWSTGYRIDIETPDGEESEYFIKILDRKRGVEMARGEYESMKTLMEYIPEAINGPIAWGIFQLDSSRSFYLTRFRHTREVLPPVSELVPIIGKLHKSSKSPTGKFGFPVTTFYGRAPMDNTWTDSWEEYFTREFRSSLEVAQLQLGNDAELANLGEDFIAKVIPRLLRPLQTGGRSIKPTLCFGDLYDPNIQIDSLTRQPFLFDACCFYGHNEMDLQCMRSSKNALGREFVERYTKEVEPSEPVDEFDDRNTLYALRNDLQTIGMWPQWATLLNHIKTEMARLLAKHPKGFEGFEENIINQRNEGAFVANRNLKIGSVDAGNAAPTESQGILKDAPVGLSN